MSNIPEAREQLEELAAQLHPLQASQLRNIVDAYLYRESPVRKAPIKHKQLTPAMKQQIKRLALLYPTMHQDEIARRVGTNAGRVSEVLNGKR